MLCLDDMYQDKRDSIVTTWAIRRARKKGMSPNECHVELVILKLFLIHPYNLIKHLILRNYTFVHISIFALWCGLRITSLLLPRYVVKDD